MLSNSYLFRTSFSYSLICFQGFRKGPIHHCVKGQTMKHSLPNILLEDTVLWGSYSTEIMKNRHPTIHVTLKRGKLILSIWKMILAYSRVERAKIHFLESIYQLMLRMDTSPTPIPQLRTNNLLLNLLSPSFTPAEGVQVTRSFEGTWLHKENSCPNLWNKRNWEKFLISYIFYTIKESME